MRRLLLSLSLLAAAAAAAELDFQDAARAVEKHYGVQRLDVPFLGLASWAAGLAGPLGVKGFEMAIFERKSREPWQAGPLKIGPGWRPVVRVRERNEHTTIFGRDEGSWIRMMLIAAEPDQTVLMKFSLRPSELMTFVSEHARR